MFEDVSTVMLFMFLIILLVSILILTLIVLLVHSGLFHPVDDVKTGKPPIGHVIVAYKFLKGAYSESGQTFTEAAFIAPKNKALGIYYDNPKKVETRNLRYAVGSILSEGSATVDEAEVKKFTDEGFKILHLPEVTFAVQTKFPHVTSLSILIAIHKAYSRLNEYIEERKLCAYPYIEYYDGEHVHFMAPLSKQKEFFVPECEATGVLEETATDMETTMNSSWSGTEGESILSNVSHPAIDHCLDSTGKGDMLDTTGNNMDEESLMEDCQGKEEIDANNSSQPESEKANVVSTAGDTEPVGDDDQTLSDDSTSSFEVLKDDNGGPLAEHI